VEAADTGDGAVVGDFDASREKNLAQLVEAGGGEGGVSFFGGAEIFFDADVDLLSVAFEPTAAAGAQRFRLLNFPQAQERAVEIPGGGFAALRGGNLQVIEMCDSRLHGLKRITTRNCICISWLGVWTCWFWFAEESLVVT